MKAELLDDRSAPPALVRVSLNDIRRSNQLFGGTRAIVSSVERRWQTWGQNGELSALDIGVGAGDVLHALAARARRRGLQLRCTGLDLNRTAAQMTRETGHQAVVAEGSRLPVAEKSFDIVILSQILHHVPRTDIPAWITRLDHIARRLVVIADLRRSHVAAVGIWLASFALGFHPVSRRDGVTSVYRGFTTHELGGLIKEAGIRTRVRRSAGFRVVASWEPT